MNPVILAELIAARYKVSPKEVFIKPKRCYTYIRAQWLKDCVKFGYGISELREITGWSNFVFNQTLIFAIEGKMLSCFYLWNDREH